MDDQQIGQLIRAVRLRRGLRQSDLAAAAGVSHSCISLVERGHSAKLSPEVLRRIAAVVEVRLELIGRWRGGDGARLVCRRHSLLAESFAAFMADRPGWVGEPEVSFAFFGERGVIDNLAWHEASRHLLVVELKTEFVDMNSVLGSLDRKARLALKVAESRGWRPSEVSVWLVVSDSATNRRHAAQHRALLRAKLPLDGRSLRPYLLKPDTPSRGLAFWATANADGARRDASATRAR